MESDLPMPPEEYEDYVRDQQAMAEDDYYDDGELDGNCHWCGGEGWVECGDPLECTRQHLKHTTPAGVYYQECRCSSCGGSGKAEDMTIW